MADDLRQRYAEALAATCRLHQTLGECSACTKRLEAVLAVRDEELATVRKAYDIVLGQLKAIRAEYSIRTREMVEELHRADAAEATLARVRALHQVHRCATDGHKLARTPVPCVNDGICRCGAANCPTLAALDSEDPLPPQELTS